MANELELTITRAIAGAREDVREVVGGQDARRVDRITRSQFTGVWGQLRSQERASGSVVVLDENEAKAIEAIEQKIETDLDLRTDAISLAGIALGNDKDKRRELERLRKQYGDEFMPLLSAGLRLRAQEVLGKRRGVGVARVVEGVGPRTATKDLIEKYAIPGQSVSEEDVQLVQGLGGVVWQDRPPTLRGREEYRSSKKYHEDREAIVSGLGEVLGKTANPELEGIADAIMRVWTEVGQGKFGRTVNAKELIVPLVALRRALGDELSGGDEAKRDKADLVARVVVGQLIEEVLQDREVRKIFGEVDLDDIERGVHEVQKDEGLAQIEAERSGEVLREQEESRRLLEERRQQWLERQDKMSNLAESLKGINIDVLERSRDAIVTLHARGKELTDREIREAVAPEVLSILGGADAVELFQVLQLAIERNRFPNSRIEFSTTLKNGIQKFLTDDKIPPESRKVLAETWIRGLQKQIDDAYFYGEMPGLDLIPPGLLLSDAEQEISAAAVSLGINLKNEMNESALMDIMAAERLEFADRADQDAVRRFGNFGGNALENYLFVNETKRRLELIRKLTPEQRKIWVARNVGTVMRGGGGYAQFNVRIVSGDALAPYIETAIRNSLDFVHKVSALKGADKKDRIYEAMRFVDPEVLGAMMEVNIPISAMLENGETIDFQLGAKDVLAVWYSSEVLSDLLVSAGYSETVDEKSYSEAQGKWFKYAIYRKMGYSDEEIRGWWRGEGEPPKIIRTNLVSFDDGEINSMDSLMGDNWWMVMLTEMEMAWSRGDYKRLPREGARRHLVGLRDILADYRRKYGMVDVTFQHLADLQIWPDYLSVEVGPMIVEPMREYIAQHSSGASAELIKRRQDVLERVAKLELVSPAEAVTIGAIALGMGDFSPTGVTPAAKIEGWKRKVRDRLGIRLIGDGSGRRAVGRVDRIGINTLRPFELWKDAYIGESVDGVWDGFDFTDLLLSKCGLHIREVERLKDMHGPLEGMVGWRVFLENASARICSLSKGVHKDGDSIWKYETRAAVAVAATMSLSDIGFQADNMPGEYEHIEPVGPAVRSEYNFRRTQFHMAVLKTIKEKLVFEGYLPNEGQDELYVMAIKLLTMNSAAWRLNDSSKLVELVEVDKVGASSHYSVDPVTKVKLREHWSRILGVGINDPILEEVESELRGHGFEYVAVGGEDASKAQLIGPHNAFTPMVTKPQDLITKLKANCETQISELRRVGAGDSDLAEKLHKFSKRLEIMKKNNFFSWNWLVDGTSNMTPDDVVGLVIDTVASSNQITEEQKALLTRYVRELGMHNVVFTNAYVIKLLRRPGWRITADRLGGALEPPEYNLEMEMLKGAGH